MASPDISPELVGVLHALKEKIEVTKRQYDLMVEMREVISAEYDLMFKQQEELRQDIVAQIETMKTMRDSMKRLKQETDEHRKRFQAEKDEAEAILITESLKKLEAINKQKKSHKAHTLFSNVFPIGTLGSKR
jgi:hypothetical protein